MSVRILLVALFLSATLSSCSPPEAPHVCAGCPKSLEPDMLNDEGTVAAANAGIQLFNAQSNDYYATIFVRVVSGTRQVVAGLKYDMVVEVGQVETPECRNTGESLSLDVCPVDEGSTSLLHLVVWDTPWEKTRYQLVSFSAVDTTAAFSTMAASYRCNCPPAFAVYSCSEEEFNAIMDGSKCPHYAENSSEFRGYPADEEEGHGGRSSATAVGVVGLLFVVAFAAVGSIRRRNTHPSSISLPCNNSRPEYITL